MPECDCGCGEQTYVIINCKNCVKNHRPSGMMTVLLFDDGIELYCKTCGEPVTHFGERLEFQFKNLNELMKGIDRRLND